jgi:hypothetical protein
VVGAEGRRALRKLVLYGPLFAAVAVAGFALGGCGEGGEALSTRTDLSGTASVGSVTRTVPTRTRTQPAAPAATTTAAATTAVTTSQTTTTATTATETTTTAVTTTAPATTTVVTQTATVPTTAPQATTGGESSSSSTPWGWIALGLALAAGLLIGLLLWHRHRAGARAWGGETADLNRRALVALDDVLAKGSVVTGQIQALAAEARALEARAPDDTSRAAAGHVRERLDELAATLESDRALRLASPPPSSEQLSYSDALIRQQVEQLQGALRVPRSSAPPP